jgi:hypothetical protein
MFKAMVIGQHDNDRRMLKAAHEMKAPARFALRKYCRNLLASGRTEDMLAKLARTPANAGGGVDLEKDDDDAE